MRIHELAAIVVAAILGVDALVHVYWMTGRTWPARDTRTLSQMVLNFEVPFTPRVLAPIVLILVAGATAVLAKAGQVGDWVPGWIASAGAAAVAVGALLRGGAGIVWALGIGADRNSAFYRLNLTAYTPMCLILCGAAAIVAF
jgi:hypothetical protein